MSASAGPVAGVAGFAALVTLVALTAPALAADHVEPIQIDYAASRGCPSESVFERELKARTTRPWSRGGRASPRALRVAIRENDGVFRGTLIVEEPSGASQSDDVIWERCDDVVSALAVKAAIAIDASALRPMPRLDPPLSGYSTYDAPRWAAPPARLSLGERREPWRFTAGAALMGTGAISPDFTTTAAVFLDVTRLRDGLEGITVRVSLMRAADDFRVNGDVVTMEWVASRLEGCPLQRRFPPFTLSPCLAIDTGAMKWKYEPPPVSRHWIALDAIAHLQATLFERLILEFQAGVIFPLTRFEFGLGADRVSGKSIHRVPAISGTLGAGTAVRFP